MEEDSPSLQEDFQLFSDKKLKDICASQQFILNFERFLLSLSSQKSARGIEIQQLPSVPVPCIFSGKLTHNLGVFQEKDFRESDYNSPLTVLLTRLIKKKSHLRLF